MMENPTWVICAPPYTPDSGGIVCLHTLADTLQTLGHETYIAPIQTDELCSPFDLNALIKAWRRKLLYSQRKITSSPKQKATPISSFTARKMAELGAIFIYPETVLGNPYHAQNVIRWLLHFPMHFRKRIHWEAGDFIVKFNDAIPRQELSGIYFANTTLKVVSYPWEIYKSAAIEYSARTGSAYMVRKGEGKSFVHPPDSICVDNLSHAETAKILGRCKSFYSYDLYTGYSLLAVVAGCHSIVVPDAGLSLDEWCPNPADRYGLSYGLAPTEEATTTAGLVLEKMLQDEYNNTIIVQNFLDEVLSHLNNRLENE